MQKNLGIILVVVVVAVLAGAYLMLKGRSAPVEPEAVGVPEALPVGGLPIIEGPSSSAVTMTATGFSPAVVTIGVGGSVTFTNGDVAPHQVASNPHPVHTNFPPLNGAVLSAGQSRTVSFPRAGTFAYHDHPNPGITGTVIVR